jgi:hypothetical protein
MATIFQYQIPEAFDQTLLLFIRQSMVVLVHHDEAGLLAWAQSIEARYSDEAFRRRSSRQPGEAPEEPSDPGGIRVPRQGAGQVAKAISKRQ